MPPETPNQRLRRQADMFRRLAELNMEAAEIAGTDLRQAKQAGEDTAKPIATLSRATRAVTATINAENALFRHQPPARAPASDPRRAKLREALHFAARTAANPPALRREADVALEQALVDDPDGQTPIHLHLDILADALGLELDMAKLSDELIGMPPRVYIRDD